uniref:N-acetylglucosaminylphosphatidylinositol deacetylase n=1 Tax=Panagrolaimus sp. ES5 TaxID=591445 RepID=A0AC34GE58_9BILA
MLCLFIVAIIPISWWILYRYQSWGLPISSNQRCLLVIAHPDDEFPDGNVKWEIEKLSKIILHYIEQIDCNLAITFDSGGISGHPNHIACFHALQYLYTNGLLPTDLQVFVLETVTILRKYSSLFDLIPSFFRSTFLNISSPTDALAIYSAMREHRSQLVWFRYLYMAFSRYIFINTLKRIPLH